MIPILYEANEQTFTSSGLGRLSDAISCKVMEERNGIYELEMVYPVDGVHFKDIENDKIIFAKPADGENAQAFRIYSVEKPINGRVTILGEHISYILNQVVVLPYSADSCQLAMSLLSSHLSQTTPFTFWTDKQTLGSFKVETPKSVRSVLGGSEGSFLDVYGTGEYKFDNFSVKLYMHRGSDNGVTIRYGKNLTDVTDTSNIQSSYTGIVPFWKGKEEDSDEDILKLLPQVVVWSSHQWDYAYARVLSVDFSDQFEEIPTDSALLAAANQYLSSGKVWEPNETINVSFVQLWQTEEYKDIAPLEQVKLCDTVTVIHPELNISTKLEVVKTDYDVLLERFNSVTLGSINATFVNTVAGVDAKIDTVIIKNKTDLEKAIAHTTELIRGGLGGYVIMKPNADGLPEEILILDEESGGDIEQAVHVIRINKNGIGFSNNGYDPEEFDTAWTIDGSFNGQYIAAGTLSADIIRTGRIMSNRDNSNYWDLDTGVFHLGPTVAEEIAQYIDASGYILRAPYIMDRNIANLSAELYKGDLDITKTVVPGSYTWWKKEDFKIDYLGAGYDFSFDLSDFTYGGSIILRFEQLTYKKLKENGGKYLLTDDGKKIVGLTNLSVKGYADLATRDGELVETRDDSIISLYTDLVKSKVISVEVDYTNGTKNAELIVSQEMLMSRMNSYDGKFSTFESEIKQTATQISTRVTEVVTEFSETIDGVYSDVDGAINGVYNDMDDAINDVYDTVDGTYETKNDANRKKTVIESEILQTARSISLSVQQSDYQGQTDARASIVVGLDWVDPTTGDTTQIRTPVGTIDLTGFVRFTNLQTAGQTTINGGNIHSGTIKLGGKAATYGNGQLEIYDENDKKVGFWYRDGLRIQDSGITLRTTLTNGTWSLWKNTGTAVNENWKQLGGIGKFNFQLRGKGSYGNYTVYDVFGINAISTTTAGFCIAIDGDPYYALNIDDNKDAHNGLDLSGFGFRHCFKGNVYCDSVYKTSNGYGWFGEGSESDPWVQTGANVQIGEQGSFGHLRVLLNIVTYGTVESAYGTCTGSDISLKKEIEDLNLEDSKKTILGLKPVKYRYKESDERLRHGFIAQDVQKVTDWDAVSLCEDTGYLNLSYEDFIADLVKVVQDQERRINELEVKYERVG